MESKTEIKEKDFNPKHIAICTTTFYPDWTMGSMSQPTVDKIRGDLAIETVRTALLNGFQVALVDGGSSEAFLNELKNLKVKVEKQQGESMSSSRRQAIMEAASHPDTRVISWLEPEKLSLVADSIVKLSTPILEGSADIVVPKRDEISFSTYPVYQAIYEKESNAIWNSVLKSSGVMPKTSEDLDVFFGPKVFKNSPQVLEMFLQKYKVKDSVINSFVDPEKYSDAIFFPVILALAKGYKVESVLVTYEHPKQQTDQEKNSPAFLLKRQKQQRDIVVGAINLVRLLHHDPKTKIIRID